jgi:protein-S-isoprenylcysteine O-methyltransferase Ste14
MAFVKGFLAPLPVLAVLAAMLWLPTRVVTGGWDWPRAVWVVTVFGAAAMVGNGVLAVARPASYAVRQQPIVAGRAKRQPLIDAVGSVAYLVWILAWLAFIPLDVFRLRLLPPPPETLAAAGLAATVAGVVITYVAIGQNRFAAPTIHDQRGEGQQVIQTGLYGVVRHPLYSGGLLVYGGLGLALGSTTAALGVAVFLAFTLARIVIEEAWLREHLPDYAAYALRVRKRLIPFVL